MATKVKTIGEQWRRYRLEVLEPYGLEMSACQRAYYAGASAVLLNLIHISNEQRSDEEAAGVIDRMLQEARSWIDRGDEALTN